MKHKPAKPMNKMGVPKSGKPSGIMNKPKPPHKPK